MISETHALRRDPILRAVASPLLDAETRRLVDEDSALIARTPNRFDGPVTLVVGLDGADVLTYEARYSAFACWLRSALATRSRSRRSVALIIH